MSGRSRWLRDGELVTGYRKTDRRRAPKRPLTERLGDVALADAPRAGERPEVRVVFLLPATLQGLVSNGSHGPGVLVLARGFVRISSWASDKCFDKARAFFRDVAKDRPGFTVTAVVISTERPHERYCRHLTVVRGALVVSVASPVEPKVFEAA